MGCCFKPSQQEMLARSSYQSCDNVTLTADDMLRALGARRLAIVGDSVTHQLWDALP